MTPLLHTMEIIGGIRRIVSPTDEVWVLLLSRLFKRKSKPKNGAILKIIKMYPCDM
jgi:hypothetical protein